MVPKNTIFYIGFPARFHIFVSEFNFDAFKFRQLRHTIDIGFSNFESSHWNSFRDKRINLWTLKFIYGQHYFNKYHSIFLYPHSISFQGILISDRSYEFVLELYGFKFRALDFIVRAFKLKKYFSFEFEWFSWIFFCTNNDFKRGENDFVGLFLISRDFSVTLDNSWMNMNFQTLNRMFLI